MIKLGLRAGCYLLFAALAVSCHAADASGDAQAIAKAPTISLRIQGRGATHGFQVELARTPQEQERGLMYRKSLPRDGGMLFLFDPPERAMFWMKNTYIPLDMLFIRADGTIAHVAANATPLSLAPIDAGETVAAVLEIAGGQAAALRIQEGDHVSWQ